MALHLANDDADADATLAAALALIDAWEADEDARSSAATNVTSNSSSTDSDDQRPASGPLASPPPFASRRGTARASLQAQRRDELVFLRRTTRDLERQLAATQQQHTRANKAPPSQALDAAAVWRQIARRQHRHRRAAETENQRLRVKVQEQIAVAKQLTRVLVRAYQDAERRNASDAHAALRVRRTSGGLALVSEADQLRRVEELREESAAIFAAAPFSGGRPVFRDVRVLDHANGEATINVDSSWVLPFPVDQVTSAFWTYLIRKTERRECGFQDCAEETRDVLVTPYQSTEAATRLVGTFVGRFVARRVLPTDTSPGLMLWDMRAEPVGFKPVSMDGVRIHNETAMRVVWADQTAALAAGSAGRMTLVQMSQRVHVQFACAETPTRRRRAGALTNYLFYSVEAELEWKQRMLETLLLRLVPPSAP